MQNCLLILPGTFISNLEINNDDLVVKQRKKNHRIVMSRRAHIHVRVVINGTVYFPQRRGNYTKQKNSTRRVVKESGLVVDYYKISLASI